MKKFRVWDVEEKCYQSGHAIALSLDGEVLLFGDKPKQDMYILEESTGLLDSKGVEIFDGDIVKLNYNEPKIVAVEYDNQMGQWHGRSIDATYLHLSSQEIREVIGNIHEGKHEN